MIHEVIWICFFFQQAWQNKARGQRIVQPHRRCLVSTSHQNHRPHQPPAEQIKEGKEGQEGDPAEDVDAGEERPGESRAFLHPRCVPQLVVNVTTQRFTTLR